MQVQDIISISNYVDKFHFIRESKLPTLNPKKNEEAVLKKAFPGKALHGDFDGIAP